jgi:uncharacterized protein YqgV (UPF0045/DUF77 family)
MPPHRSDEEATRPEQRVYDLACNDCAFERVVEGEIDEVLDVIEAHHDEYRTPTERHIVNTELRE